jgi:hypothetical protein
MNDGGSANKSRKGLVATNESYRLLTSRLDLGYDLTFVTSFACSFYGCAVWFMGQRRNCEVYLEGVASGVVSVLKAMLQLLKCEFGGGGFVVRVSVELSIHIHCVIAWFCVWKVVVVGVTVVGRDEERPLIG